MAGSGWARARQHKGRARRIRFTAADPKVVVSGEEHFRRITPPESPASLAITLSERFGAGSVHCWRITHRRLLARRFIVGGRYDGEHGELLVCR